VWLTLKSRRWSGCIWQTSTRFTRLLLKKAPNGAWSIQDEITDGLHLKESSKQPDGYYCCYLLLFGAATPFAFGSHCHCPTRLSRHKKTGLVGKVPRTLPRYVQRVLLLYGQLIRFPNTVNIYHSKCLDPFANSCPMPIANCQCAHLVANPVPSPPRIFTSRT
jgi:hypothetical protein